GIPRYGIDIDENNLAPETGIEPQAISYTKGCYIGQEVIARIRTYGQVTKTLRGLRLASELKVLPAKGARLFKEDKEVGYITSAISSPTYNSNLALGYVRRETNQPGSHLKLRQDAQDSDVEVVELPFSKNFT